MNIGVLETITNVETTVIRVKRRNHNKFSFTSQIQRERRNRMLELLKNCFVEKNVIVYFLC